MASLGQIIFYSMVTLIIVFMTVIILILSLALTVGSAEVLSKDKMAIANLGEDALLSCYLNSDSQNAQQKDVSVSWQKTGVTGLVYQYEDGAPTLSDQNSQFKGRTHLFPDALLSGNASLLLRRVRGSDAGEYSCSISSSAGGGKVDINLRTGAFSAPSFKFSNGVLTAEASSWLPKPNVTWSHNDGRVLSGFTNFEENSAGIFSLVSTLQPVNVSQAYTCSIQNDLVTAVSTATATDSDVSVNTYFIYSAASIPFASTYLSIMATVLCMYSTT
ncbi:hypothetical protein CesoFtcFv8_013622 [Champsocephalus esox]|uniref:Ig-like domain-containing protein n=1 Tax=Champsocephalus esox TaxID=159716 RepID=A0AAN8BV43_9TELE|nr:hypothetical protein CesoFtcFv8_013622 [Champsocephalus esox]